MLNLGIVLSAGGSAFEAMARIVAHQDCRFTVITDRPCGAEAAAARVGADLVRIEDRGREAFSLKAAQTLRERGIEHCLLNFGRLVSRELFDTVETYNIHPSLLPAFPGMKAVETAHALKVRLIGCSLHRVDETIDGGALVAQIACRVDPAWPIPFWQKRAYLMKVYCGLVWVSLMLQAPCPADLPVNASHAIPADWRDAFDALQSAEGVWVI